MERKNFIAKTHIEILTPKQTEALKHITHFVNKQDFYLAGGTALAIHLGHRQSRDFDWFTFGSIEDPMGLAGEIRKDNIPFRTGYIEKGTLYGTISGVKVSFFEYHYPLLKPCLAMSEFGCKLASLQDIACMKLAAVAQRGSKKDFVDIYALGANAFSLKDMLIMYQRKYTVKDIAHVLFALAYFDNADMERMPLMLWKTDWKTIKETIRSWVREMAAPISP